MMKVSFTDFVLVSLLVAGLCLFCGCSDAASKNNGSGSGVQKFSQLQDLNKPSVRLAVMSDLISTKETQKALPNATYLEFNMPSDCYVALSSGRVDGVAYDRPPLDFAAMDLPDFVVLPEDVAMGHVSVGLTKKNADLGKKVNDFIRQYRENGMYLEIYNRWINTKNPVMPEIPAPKNPVGVLRVGLDVSNPPLCYLEKNVPVGFDVEFARQLGVFLNMEVKFLSLPYDGMVSALAGKKIDLAIAQMDATEEREESIIFSDEYIDSPVAIMIREKDYNGPDNTGRGELEEGNKVVAFAKSLASSFEKTFIRESRWKLILQGLGTTLLITFFAVLLGTLLALPICCMCRAHNPVVSWLGNRYVSLIMGTPILVVLMILYYVVFAKVDISSIIVAILAFALDFGAYTSVTLRSGIEGIPKGQTEAALALGHTPLAAFFRFILPQAIRTILPVYRGEVISTLKSTSVVGYIAIMDLTKVGDIIRSRTYEAFFPLIAIAVIYFIAAKGLTAILVVAEKRMDAEHHRKRMQKGGTK